MPKFLGQCHALTRTLVRLIGIAESPERQCTLSFAADAGVVTTIHQGVVPVPVGVVKRQAPSNVFLAAGILAVPDKGRPSRVMRLQGQLGITNPFGHFDQLPEVSEPVVGLFVPAQPLCGNPHAPCGGKLRRIVVQSLRQFAGAPIGLPYLGRAVALVR